MDIRGLIELEDEVIQENQEDLITHIAGLFEPPAEESDTEEPAEVIRPISIEEALQLVQRLKIHEEQSEDCNNDWIRSLDQYEKVVKDRRLKRLHQSQLDSWLTKFIH